MTIAQHIFIILILGMRRNFVSYIHGPIDALGEPYDFNSIMHYDNKAFTKNGGDTIRSLKKPKMRLGQLRRLTRIDVSQINKLYRCKKRKPEGMETVSWYAAALLHTLAKKHKYSQHICQKALNNYQIQITASRFRLTFTGIREWLNVLPRITECVVIFRKQSINISSPRTTWHFCNFAKSCSSGNSQRVLLSCILPLRIGVNATCPLISFLTEKFFVTAVNIFFIFAALVMSQISKFSMKACPQAPAKCWFRGFHQASTTFPSGPALRGWGGWARVWHSQNFYVLSYTWLARKIEKEGAVCSSRTG